MKIFDLFSGCGGFRLAAELNGFKSIGYSEINKYAIEFYNNVFEGETNYGDATKIETNSLPDFDLLCAGFPCQSFSIAGKRQGFNDTRGTMFFEVLRILKDKRPRYFILENVKGLLSHDNGQTFKTILKSLTDLRCSTKCKKEAQVKYNRPKIENKIFKNLYLKRYKLVQSCAFRLCEGNKMKLQFMEDCMQYGFIELWKTYIRNGFECSDKYLKTAVYHAMLDGMRYWFEATKRLIPADEFDIQLMADKINGGIYDR